MTDKVKHEKEVYMNKNVCISVCAIFLSQGVFAQDVSTKGSAMLADKVGLSTIGNGAAAVSSNSTEAGISKSSDMSHVLSTSAVAKVQVGLGQVAGSLTSNKVNKVFELSSPSGTTYCSNLNKAIKDLPKYTFDISSIVTMLKAPCVEQQQALIRLKEQQGQMSGSLGPINGLSLIASSAPQGTMELATFYSHLFSNVFTVEENAPKLDQSDLILYQSLYKKLKLHTTDVLLKDLAHVYVVREAINSLKPERKTTVGKLNDLKAIKDLGVIAEQMEQHMNSYHARLAVNHMRLSYALENFEQFESVRQNFDLLIPMILESSDSQNPFYKKTLTKSQCSFMQSYAPGSWESQRNNLQIKCE